MSDEQDQSREQDPTANADANARSGGGSGNFSTGIRLGLAAALGHSGFDERDRYEVFGWEEQPTADEYYGLYLRNPYVYAAIAQKPATTWRDSPDIIDGTHPEDVDPSDEALTEFERRVKALAREKDVWSYTSRVDRLAGIGTHGILVLDLGDTDSPDDFADAPTLSESDGVGLDSLRGFRVYSAASIDDIDYGDPGSDRWGLPETYHVDLRDDPVTEDSAPGTEDLIEIHHQRVIDVPAQPLDDDETHARPRAEIILNVAYDIEKTLGAAAELAYAGAKQDIHINFDPEKVNTDKVTDSDEELQNWYHGRNPWIRTVGGEVEQISPPEIVDPSGVIDTELRAFSAATGIPKQLLDGSAAGEIAGAEQNERDYFGTIGERREQFATPHLVRATLNRLVELGVLPEPEGPQDSPGRNYRVEWPDLTELSQADVASLRNERAQIVKRMSAVAPELQGERAETFVESGEFPEREEADIEPMEPAEAAGAPPAQPAQPSQPAVPDGGESEDESEGE